MQKIFTPEMLTEEQKALGATALDFIQKEVLPVSKQIEAKEPGLVPKLLRKAADIGLLMVEIPEEFGGLGLGKVASTVITEKSAEQGSYEVSFLCHTGIGTLPIIYWGSEAQKKKYLPRLANGEMLGAYALTEAGAGSDALGGHSTAKLSADGKFYVLNGEKLYITNGGFADLFTIFAKVDGHLTAFLVERNFKGLSFGPEEKKMGIHGSSTVAVAMQDVQVPAENVLGEVGKGHKIAFNTLNVGRWKLGAGSLGSCKELISRSAKYVMERVQFGRPIGKFQLIRNKIAECAMRTYMLESLVYRYAGTLDEAHAKAKDGAEKVKQLEEYVIEASAAKVYGSETLQFVADETVQMFGGYGFCDDYEVERFYRDCRINRIFEGTNEINRLLIASTFIKHMITPPMTEQSKTEQIASSDFAPSSVVKKVAAYLAGVGAKKYADKIVEEEALLAVVADIVIEGYAIESGMLRAMQTKDKLQGEMVRTYMAARIPLLKVAVRQQLVNIAAGDKKEFAKLEKALDEIIPEIVYDIGKGMDLIAAAVIPA